MPKKTFSGVFKQNHIGALLSGVHLPHLEEAIIDE